MFQKKCDTCQIYQPQAMTCPLMPALQGKITANDYCSQHKDNILTCERCGRGLLEPIIEVKSDGIHIYCDQCYQFS